MMGAHTAHRTGSSSPRSSDSEGVKRQTAPLHRSPENWIKMNVAQSKRRADDVSDAPNKKKKHS